MILSASLLQMPVELLMQATYICKTVVSLRVALPDHNFPIYLYTYLDLADQVQY